MGVWGWGADLLANNVYLNCCLGSQVLVFCMFFLFFFIQLVLLSLSTDFISQWHDNPNQHTCASTCPNFINCRVCNISRSHSRDSDKQHNHRLLTHWKHWGPNSWRMLWPIWILKEGCGGEQENNRWFVGDFYWFFIAFAHISLRLWFSSSARHRFWRWLLATSRRRAVGLTQGSEGNRQFVGLVYLDDAPILIDLVSVV
jgi:hypothetical protein